MAPITSLWLVDVFDVLNHDEELQQRKNGDVLGIKGDLHEGCEQHSGSDTDCIWPAFLDPLGIRQDDLYAISKLNADVFPHWCDNE